MLASAVAVIAAVLGPICTGTLPTIGGMHLSIDSSPLSSCANQCCESVYKSDGDWTVSKLFSFQQEQNKALRWEHCVAFVWPVFIKSRCRCSACKGLIKDVNLDPCGFVESMPASEVTSRIATGRGSRHFVERNAPSPA